MALAAYSRVNGTEGDATGC